MSGSKIYDAINFKPNKTAADQLWIIFLNKLPDLPYSIEQYCSLYYE